MQLRDAIQAGRVLQRELKGSLEEYLAEVERLSMQHYIKAEEFKAAMARLNRPWYAVGFDIYKLQVEDELVKAKQTRIISLDMLDRLDPKKKGRYVFPEVELVLEELIPKPARGRDGAIVKTCSSEPSRRWFGAPSRSHQHFISIKCGGLAAGIPVPEEVQIHVARGRGVSIGSTTIVPCYISGSLCP
ncbi:hypothetical protein Dimus_008304 [Dionaea muscipula]